MEIDATQVLDLNLTEDDDESRERKQIGLLVTKDHKEMTAREFIIYEGTNIIGRDERSDLMMTVKSLSKKHACIEASEDGCVICDFGSRNKTRKGKLVLKPSVRYEIKDNDEITFGNLICNFLITEIQREDDGDETGSLTASETDSESMLPTTTSAAATAEETSHQHNNNIESKETIVGQSDDEKDSPSIFTNSKARERVNDAEELNNPDDSLNSSDIVLPTQKYTENNEDDRESVDSMEEELKNVNKENMGNAYVLETDEETDAEENVREKERDSSIMLVIGQTPGISLKKRDATSLPESDLDNTFGTPKDKSTQPTEAGEASVLDAAKFELFLDSPPPNEPAADKLSCSFSNEVAEDQRFADTIPIDESRTTRLTEESESVHHGTIGKLLAEKFADTLPIMKGETDTDEKTDYEDIVGTYQFDTDNFNGNLEDKRESEKGSNDSETESESDEKKEEENEEKTQGKDEDSITHPPPPTAQPKMLLAQTGSLKPSTNFHTPTFESSQEVPYNKSCRTSTRILDSFQSFGTPFSSINASDSSHGPQSIPKMPVVSDSDDEPATQAYDIASPVKVQHKFMEKAPALPKALTSLPGASSVDVYEAVDTGTQMSSDEEKRMATKTDDKISIETDSTQAYAEMNTQAYAQMNTQAYGEAATQAYGEAATQVYGDAATQANGEAATQAYGETATQAYGEAATQAYGEAATQAYGDAATQVYGEAATQAYGEVASQAFGESATKAHGIKSTQAYRGSGKNDGDKEIDEDETQAYFGKVVSDDETASEIEDEKNDDNTKNNQNGKRGEEASVPNPVTETIKKIQSDTSKVLEAIEDKDNKIDYEQQHSENMTSPTEHVESNRESGDFNENEGNGDLNFVTDNANRSKRVRRKKTSEVVNHETINIDNRENEYGNDAKDNVSKPKRGKTKSSTNIGLSQSEYMDNNENIGINDDDNDNGTKLKRRAERSSFLELVENDDNENIDKHKNRTFDDANDSKRGRNKRVKLSGNDGNEIADDNENMVTTSNKKPISKRGRPRKTTITRTDELDAGNDKKDSGKDERKRNRSANVLEIEAKENVVDATRKSTRTRGARNTISDAKQQSDAAELSTRGKRRKTKVIKNDKSELAVEKDSVDPEVIQNEDEVTKIIETKKTKRGKISTTVSITDYLTTEDAGSSNRTSGSKRLKVSGKTLDTSVTDDSKNEIEIDNNIIGQSSETKRRFIKKTSNDQSNIKSQTPKAKGRGKRKATEDAFESAIEEDNEHLNIPLSKTKGRSKRKAEEKLEIDGQIVGENDLVENKPKRERKSNLNKARNKNNVNSNESLEPSDEPSSNPSTRISKQRKTGKRKRIDLNESQSSTSSVTSSSRRSSIGGKPKVVFTGISDKSVEKIVTDLRGTTIEHLDKATHLVTDKVRRTVKFMCAVAKGVPIVTPDWLRRCKNAGVFVDHNEYLLKDSTAEKQYKFKLEDSLEKARNQPLLKDFQIHVTKSVKPEAKCMKEMIECCGGKYISKSTKLSNDIIIISCEEDAKEWSKFKGNNICTNELLLTGILRQEIDTEMFALETDGDSSEPTKHKKRRT